MDGIVSTSWLAQHSEDPTILLVDTRSAAEYAAGHIPGSVNIPFIVPECAWISYGPDELLLQLPADNDLFASLSAAGVSKSRRIIISDTKGTPPYPQAQGTRVAMTLHFAGFPDIHVLNGGIAQWQTEGRPITTQVPNISPSGITGSLDRRDFVDREYVKAAINRTIILDARDPTSYRGEVLEEWAHKRGHIQSAKNLPMISLLDADGNFKNKGALAELLESVLGSDVEKDTEIIVYCGAGGYASAVWWVFKTVLDFSNVKFYGGAAQDWVKHYEMEV